MATDPVKYFLGINGPELDATQTVQGTLPEDAPAQSGLFSTFRAGAQSGAEGLATDIEYFKALFNTLTGDEQQAAADVKNARVREEFAAAPLANVESFEEFINEPTINGFFTQIAKGTGQVLPSAVSTIASGGTAGLAAVVGRAALSKGSKKVAEKLVKDSVERTAKGVADVDEQAIAQSAYDLFKKGALTGAAASEYAPLAGSNLSEALDSGRELDRGTAFRAAAVAAPQALIGVAGEVALLKLIGKTASKRSVREGSLFGRLASDISKSTFKGGAIEGATEVAQEGISVINRSQMDEDFDSEDAAIRVAEAAFAGFFGGAGIGAAGGSVGATISNRGEISTNIREPVKAATDKAADIFDKARRYMDNARSQRVEQEAAEDIVGDLPDGQTSPEPKAFINAQLNAMTNPSSTKQAVWEAGDQPKYSARTNRPTEITVNGSTAWAAFVPGRGTIISTNKDLVAEVVASGATDESLSIALGYSSSKPSADATLVAQALDAAGNVVSEEVTSPTNTEAALNAARGLAPEGGSVRVVTTEQALEERAKLFQQEQGPDIQVTDDPDSFEESDGLDPTQEPDDVDALRNELQSISEQEAEQTVVGQFTPKTDGRTFPGEEAARAEYVQEFGDTDFNSPEFAGITEAALKAAVRESRQNPNSVVTIGKRDGKFEVVRSDFDKLYRFVDGNVEQRLTFPKFIEASVRKAKRSSFARRSSVSIVTPDGNTARVNLVDLTNAGRRLVENRETGTFEAGDPITSSRQGLLEILSDLALEGYEVQVLGRPIFSVLEGKVPEGANVPAAVVAGRTLGLAELLNTRQDPRTGIQTDAQIAESESLAEFDQQRAKDTRSTSAGYQLPPETRTEEIVPGDPDYVEGVRQFREVPLEQAAENISEVEAFAGDPRDDIAPDRRAGQAPSTKTSTAPDPFPDPTKFDNSLVNDVIKTLLRAIKMTRPPRVFSAEKLRGLTDAQLSTIFTVPEIVSLKAVLARMEARPETGGIYSGKYNFAVINESGNSLSDALTAAHEIGHALYQQEQKAALENNALRPRLIKSFKQHPKHSRYVELYGDEAGFEEWYADQVARWAAKQYTNRAAKNMSERHFKGLVTKLRTLWRTMKSGFKVRKGPKSPEFEEYIRGVVEAKQQDFFANEAVRYYIPEDNQTPQQPAGGGQAQQQQPAGDGQAQQQPVGEERTATTGPDITFPEKALVYSVREAVVKEGGEALGSHWNNKIRQLTRGTVKPLMRILATADGVLRMHAGDKLADLFYVRAQESGQGGRIGMVGAVGLKLNELKNSFQDLVGDLDDPAVKEAFIEASSSAKTESLRGKALEIRLFLDSFYDDYIAPSNTDIKKDENYFPVALDLLAVDFNAELFVSIIIQYNPEVSVEQVRKAVATIRNYNIAQYDAQEAGADVGADPLDPAASVEKARKLTRNVPREVLAAYGFLQKPEEAFIGYMRHVVKRVEYNKATDNGALLKTELDGLSPEDREVAIDVIKTYMGYQSSPLNPMWRKLNSWGQFLQFVTVLPFATIASFTDLAGPIINSKEFSLDTFQRATKEIIATIKNPEERRQLARDIGVITNETVANAWVTQAEQDYMDPKVRKLSDAWFRAIGLDYFTKFSREFAAGMGVSFINHHAARAGNGSSNPRSVRYLEDLGLTVEDVMKWRKEGRKFSTPEGQKVKQALQRFVESSILRPNAAERPIWASDPRWALVWQLKSYFYAYSKVIGGGILKEARTRIKETPGVEGEFNSEQLTAVLGIFALTAVATMPLAMLGMELREYAKTGLAWALPGVDPKARYFRTDRMDWDEYLFEVFDRSGFLGPLSMGVMANQQAEWGKSPLVSLLGPTAETIDTAFTNGWEVDKTLKGRILPIYNQLL